MELHARQRRHTRRTPPKDAAPPRVPVAAVAPVSDGEASRHSITIRYDTLLYGTLHNMIRSSHTAQDFTYPSLADFIRAALRAYQHGMVLTEQDTQGPKLETSLRVDRDLWLFYKALPSRMRAKILERVLRTFLQQHAAGTGTPAEPDRTRPPRGTGRGGRTQPANAAS